MQQMVYSDYNKIRQISKTIKSLIKLNVAEEETHFQSQYIMIYIY